MAHAGSSKMLVSPEGAAAILDCSRATVYVLLAKKELMAIAIGRSRKIPISELEAFVARKLEREAAKQVDTAPAA